MKKLTRAESLRQERLLFNFSLTLSDWQKIADYQEGKCALCQRAPDKTLHTHHDHGTGQIIALLCINCNRFLKLADSSLEILERLVEIVKNPPATVALGGPRYGLRGKVDSKRKYLQKINKDRFKGKKRIQPPEVVAQLLDPSIS